MIMSNSGTPIDRVVCLDVKTGMMTAEITNLRGKLRKIDYSLHQIEADGGIDEIIMEAFRILPTGVRTCKISGPDHTHIVYTVHRGSKIVGMVEKVRRPIPGRNENPFVAYLGVGESRTLIGEFHTRQDATRTMSGFDRAVAAVDATSYVRVQLGRGSKA